MVAAAVVGAGIVGSVVSSRSQKSAADSAANAQNEASQRGIEAQNAQFAATQKLLSPYVNAGNGAVNAQQNLLGLNGQGAQQSAIDGIQNGAQFQALNQQGLNAINQNASATGGLRGGNVQAALGQFSPNLLNSLIQQQYSNLGGLTNVGQNAAAGVGNAGSANANAITGLYGQQGAASAGQALASGRADAQFGNTLGGSLGAYQALGGFRPANAPTPAYSNDGTPTNELL